ncbi:hypothetical protein NPIL_92901, partial [Nephila pilipes]
CENGQPYAKHLSCARNPQCKIKNLAVRLRHTKRTPPPSPLAAAFEHFYNTTTAAVRHFKTANRRLNSKCRTHFAKHAILSSQTLPGISKHLPFVAGRLAATAALAMAAYRSR